MGDKSYLLELNFDDYENAPWTEIQYPSSISEAKRIIKKLEEDDNNFMFSLLYETNMVEIDLEEEAIGYLGVNND